VGQGRGEGRNKLCSNIGILYLMFKKTEHFCQCFTEEETWNTKTDDVSPLNHQWHSETLVILSL